MQNSTTPSSSSGWRKLRRCVMGFAILLTVIALFYLEEDLRGYYVWSACQKESAAKGLDLNPNTFVPAPVPDDQNFAATPFFAALFDFNPAPLKPGQSAWRDTNAYQQAMNFPQDFLKAYDSVRTHLEKAEPPTMDLAALANALRKQSKSPARDYATRAEAGADVLRAFDPYTPALDELRAASARPYSRFKIQYDEPNPMEILLPHLYILKKTSILLSYRASAELAVGNNDAALADVKLALSLMDSIRSEPFMISHLVRLAIWNTVQRPLWEGLAAHAWSEAQLQPLQEQLSQTAFLEGLPLTTGYEIAVHATTVFEFLHHHMWTSLNQLPLVMRVVPNGWFHMERASFVRTYSSLMSADYDAQGRTINPKAVEAAQAKVKKSIVGPISRLWQHRVFVQDDMPDMIVYCQKTARGQTTVNEAVIACALERYRLANGQFPGTLDALTPKYLATIPREVVNTDSLKYKLTGANQFTLSSAGWNDSTRGDWMWNVYPQN